MLIFAATWIELEGIKLNDVSVRNTNIVYHIYAKCKKKKKAYFMKRGLHVIVRDPGQDYEIFKRLMAENLLVLTESIGLLVYKGQPSSKGQDWWIAEERETQTRPILPKE